MKMRILTAFCASFALAASANAGLVLNEALVSTTGADAEFIEIYNGGSTTVDLTNYFIEEIESDGASSAIGTVDDIFLIPSGTIAPGGFFLIGNSTFESVFGIVPDLSLNLSIENSASTLILNNAAGDDLYVAFLDDGDGIPQATPDISVGPDGPFLPAGYFLDGDGGSTAGFLEFSPLPSESATPGAPNIPEPGTIALALLSLASAGAVSMRSRLG